MQKFLSFTSFTILFVLIFAGCSKNKKEPLVITPTVNPLPYSVLVYYITPTDKAFNADYYSGIKSCALSLQNWFKGQMGNGKTFLLNPVVVDTATSTHNSAWFGANNGADISGSGSYAYHNTVYEIKQLLGTNFNTTNNLYFVFVTSDFPDETIPKGLAAEGLSRITALAGSNQNQAIASNSTSRQNAPSQRRRLQACSPRSVARQSLWAETRLIIWSKLIRRKRCAH